MPQPLITVGEQDLARRLTYFPVVEEESHRSLVKYEWIPYLYLHREERQGGIVYLGTIHGVQD